MYCIWKHLGLNAMTVSPLISHSVCCILVSQFYFNNPLEVFYLFIYGVVKKIMTIIQSRKEHTSYSSPNWGLVKMVVQTQNTFWDFRNTFLANVMPLWMLTFFFLTWEVPLKYDFFWFVCFKGIAGLYHALSSIFHVGLKMWKAMRKYTCMPSAYKPHTFSADFCTVKF